MPKSESHESENGGQQQVSTRPILKANGHRRGQGQLPEILSPDALSALAYPSKKSLEGRPPTPESYWLTTPLE
ncbi:hypothetical protein GCM10008021_24440 [Deinococcus wulumuqiensis]|uniref:Uncharacterized protein n=1 Tax=Deinococcus wulumuqiensis TaxID=980427 RepID=A0ABQ2PYJ8_9DEIO|nr:hypothetical protein GCM10008021_24440 [Deinococcus wulumuqiensis]